MSSVESHKIPDSAILIPLDGSERAEGALPVAVQVGRSLHRTLLLTRITPVVPTPFAAASAPLPPESYQQLLDDEQRAARDYLEQQATRLEQQGQSARTSIVEGDPASALLDICSSEHVGLVVMTTHGRTGVARFVLGSVADRLVRYSHVPVLLLRSYPSPDSGAVPSKEVPITAAPQLDCALVPLDGSLLAEAALQIVRELGGALFHHITLQRVLNFTADEKTCSEATSYLETRAAELRAELQDQDCTITTLVQAGVVPSQKISEQAEKDGCLVVMATHGRGGLRRWVLGSVANELVHMAHVPVLLVHPANTQPVD